MKGEIKKAQDTLTKFLIITYFQNFLMNASNRGGVTCSSLERKKDELKILVNVS